jgi:inactive STAND
MDDSAISSSAYCSDPSYRIQQNVKGDHNQAMGQVDRSTVIGVVNNYQFSSDGTPQFEIPTKSLERKIPALLPYLLNRSEQKDELEKALQNYLKKPSFSPLVCIIHGNQFQSHDRFLERLKKLSLPEWIGLDPSQTSIKDCILCWPAGQKSVDNLESHFCKDLANQFFNSQTATAQEINQFLCQYPDPVIIRTHLLTEDWQNQELMILDKILQFWQNWPDLNPEKKLIIFLSIKYKDNKYQSSSRSVLRIFFNFCRNFLRFRRYQKANNKMRGQLQILAASNFQRFNRLSCIVLPELMEISQKDVEDWARIEVEKVLGCDVADKLMDKIERIYHDWINLKSLDKIPMSILGDELTTLLKNVMK